MSRGSISISQHHCAPRGVFGRQLRWYFKQESVAFYWKVARPCPLVPETHIPHVHVTGSTQRSELLEKAVFHMAWCQRLLGNQIKTRILSECKNLGRSLWLDGEVSSLCLFPHNMDEWFSNLSVNQNTLENMLKPRFLSSTSRVYDSAGLRWAWESAFLTSFQMMVTLLVL